jgi:hypothetical protein
VRPPSVDAVITSSQKWRGLGGNRPQCRNISSPPTAHGIARITMSSAGRSTGTASMKLPPNVSSAVAPAHPRDRVFTSGRDRVAGITLARAVDCSPSQWLSRSRCLRYPPRGHQKRVPGRPPIQAISRAVSRVCSQGAHPCEYVLELQLACGVCARIIGVSRRLDERRQPL